MSKVHFSSHNSRVIDREQNDVDKIDMDTGTDMDTIRFFTIIYAAIYECIEMSMRKDNTTWL